ncbi:MAG: hypothetical protein V1908_02345 [Candidatus Peregrinibacteria bacterium]
MTENDVSLSAVKADFRSEPVQFFFRKHWTYFSKIVILGILIGLLVLMVMIGLYGLVRVFPVYPLRVFFVFVALIGSFLYLTLFFLELLSYYFELTIVTSHRVILVQKTIFLKNDSGAIDLPKIQDLSVESRGILQNYLRYGKMIITISASVPPVVIENVPNPHEMLERANRVKREHILKRQERRLKTSSELEEEALESPYLQDIRSLLKSTP